MKLNLAQAKVSEISYLPGEVFTLCLRFYCPVEDLDLVSNISINLYRAARQRNQIEFGFGIKPHIDGNSLTITQRLATTLKPGLYFIGAVTLMCGDQKQQNITFKPLFFAIRNILEAPLSLENLSKRVADLGQVRQAYEQREIATASIVGDSPPKRYRVLIFAVGCLLHVKQQLNGFAIVPLQRGLSSTRMQEIVDNALKKNGLESFTYSDQFEIQHEQSTPTFLIDYFCVLGVSYDDVLSHCRKHADLMFDLLGLDRGQKPKEFCCMAIDQATNQSWHTFSMPWYRGNLLSDFNPTSTANLIETVTPRLEADPFLRLLVRSYADATAEDDPNIGFFRTWTVLELLADRAIPKGQQITHTDGTVILNQKGNSKDTNAKEARVYEFIRTSGTFQGHFVNNIEGTERRCLIGADENHPGFTEGTRLISLWDVVRAAYAIRNCIAHEGYFSTNHIDLASPDQVLAVDLIETSPIDPREWIHDQAHMAVRKELNRE